MEAGKVAVLIVHDANPVYALPKSSGFAAAMAKVPYKVSTALVPRRDGGALATCCSRNHTRSSAGTTSGPAPASGRCCSR